MRSNNVGWTRRGVVRAARRVGPGTATDRGSVRPYRGGTRLWDRANLHINPAVSIGAWAAGRLPGADLPGYIIAQVLGGIAGAALLLFVLSGKAGGYDLAASGLGETRWSGLAVTQAFVVEFVATFLFVVVILGATSKSGSTPAAGLAIGLALLVMHLAFIRATGASLNPARSLGPALLAGGGALSDVWLYLVAPPLGALTAGLLFKSSFLEAR
jgi:aquaporin Z